MHKIEVLYFYWVIAGGFVGFGFLDILMRTLGEAVLFLLVGMGMCLVGAFFCRIRRL